MPQSSIVAVLNAEMMGRNAPDSRRPAGRDHYPHMNSSDLVKTALAANQAGPKFKLDTEWDRPTHPEGWYFRSDHLPYARLGIPALCTPRCCTWITTRRATSPSASITPSSPT
ncbi:MAG: M28 family peptidase [Hymenobacter sp.]